MQLTRGDYKLQRTSHTLQIDNSVSKKGLLFKQDVELSDILDISFETIIGMNYYPLLSISLLHRIINEPNDILRRDVLKILTKNMSMIRPYGEIRCEEGYITDRYLRYFKYLKGMLTFLKVHTFLSDDLPLDKNNEKTETKIVDYKEVFKSLKENYGINCDSHHSIRFVPERFGGVSDYMSSKVNIGSEAYEDYLYFHHTWYNTNEFKRYEDIFYLKGLCKDFEFNLRKIEYVLRNYLNIFKIFLDTQEEPQDIQTTDTSEGKRGDNIRLFNLQETRAMANDNKFDTSKRHSVLQRRGNLFVEGPNSR